MSRPEMCCQLCGARPGEPAAVGSEVDGAVADSPDDGRAAVGGPDDSGSVAGGAIVGEAVLLSWVMDRQDGRTSWTCPNCAAANIRSVEAKLEPQWW
ncbi:MAG: hypothetical protein ACR2N4_10395 [Jatrophihabitans sp.]